MIAAAFAAIPGLSRIAIKDRNAFNSVRLGLEVIYALQKLYPGKIDLDVNHQLIGSTSTVARTRTAKVLQQLKVVTMPL
jgi:hypothetical protein